MAQRATKEDLPGITGETISDPPLTADELAVLEEVQRRVLWLSTNIIHHANNVRENTDGAKVGGHQASSASVVSILTALYFNQLQRGDRVSIKPHASPVFHAIQYLMGQLPKRYLTTLREYGGIQAYPSRTKDPDLVDFSTGSVGLGAVAPLFAGLGHAYVKNHFQDVTSSRFIAIIGDAELDEGNIWEAIIEEALAPVSNCLWIVDLNRQSLDRVIPGIRAAQLKALFHESGWNVLEVKYGRALRAVFAREHGEYLRQAIDDMDNEEYQTLIRLDGATLRKRLADRPNGRYVVNAVEDIPDDELPGLIANLAGHDLQDLVEVIAEGLRPKNGPTVIFAYTIKGWNLPFFGDALNHSALLNAAQMEEVREKLGIAKGEEWERFPEDSPAGRLCRESWERIYADDVCPPPAVTPDMIPEHLDHNRTKQTSTQEALGRLLTRLADLEHVGERIVTTAPDVSVSTNLGGWINKAGVWSAEEARIYAQEGTMQLLRWEPKPSGQHIELGISEMNLFMMLDMLGLSHELSGQILFPIGTVYDPFILRGLDALIYGVYSNSKFIFAGTPSGITLSPEGGAHQSTITPSVGIELPGLRSWEPCFAQELEWMLLDALRECCDREDGLSTYLRLSTKLIDQSLITPSIERFGIDELRRQVLAGGYRMVDARLDAPDTDPRDTVQIVATGVMIPEALEAARMLHEEGVAANVLNLTSPQLLFQQWRKLKRWQIGVIDGEKPTKHLETLIPANERKAPIVTVQDGASHALAWLGSVYGTRVISLGVDAFGQSASRDDLYRHFEIDPQHIAAAAFAALDEQ